MVLRSILMFHTKRLWSARQSTPIRTHYPPYCIARHTFESRGNNGSDAVEHSTHSCGRQDKAQTDPHVNVSSKVKCCQRRAFGPEKQRISGRKTPRETMGAFGNKFGSGKWAEVGSVRSWMDLKTVPDDVNEHWRTKQTYNYHQRRLSVLWCTQNLTHVANSISQLP